MNMPIAQNGSTPKVITPEIATSCGALSVNLPANNSVMSNEANASTANSTAICTFASRYDPGGSGSTSVTPGQLRISSAGTRLSHLILPAHVAHLDGSGRLCS